MKNYDLKTDNEINISVLKFLNKNALIEIDRIEKLIKQKQLPSGCPISVPSVVYPDFCNDPACAWPIILKNEISIGDPVSCGLDEKWMASKFYPEFNKKDIDWDDKNPLRAAMIVFLMMNDE